MTEFEFHIFPAFKTGGLLRARRDGQAVRPKLEDRPYLEGRAEHAALGGGRGRPAGLAADQPWHRLYTATKRRHGKSNPAKAAVAREVLIAAWHVVPRGEPFKPSAQGAPNLSGNLRHSSGRPDGPQTI
jgi:hypothetical protein